MILAIICNNNFSAETDKEHCKNTFKFKKIL